MDIGIRAQSETMNEAIRKQDGAAKPGRRTASREVRRRQLIDATISSIARHGIGGTTMQSVTEFAGLSLGIVNFHFQSKQNLFEETLVFLAKEHHDHWLQAYRDAGLSACAKLTAIVEAHFDARICTPKKLAVWYAFYGEVGRRKIYRQLIDDIDAERFTLSTRLCEQITEEGGYAGMTPQRVANLLEALYDGLWLDMLTYPESCSRQQARAHVFAFLAQTYPDHFDLREFD